MASTLEIYREEVEELTEDLRNDPDAFTGLRAALIANGFDPSHILFAAYMEDEFEQEYGAFVTEDDRVYDFSRSTVNSAPNIETFAYEEMRDLVVAIEKYPQVEAALKMLPIQLEA